MNSAAIASILLFIASNLETRGAWKLCGSRTYWLLITTYISTLATMLALLFTALQAEIYPRFSRDLAEIYTIDGGLMCALARHS